MMRKECNIMKIVFAASSGGHLEQLLMLKPLMEKYDSILVTEKTDYSPGKFNIKTYYMKQINRKEILLTCFFTKKIADINHADYTFHLPNLPTCIKFLVLITWIF